MTLSKEIAETIMNNIAEKAKSGEELTDSELAARHYQSKYNRLMKIRENEKTRPCIHCGALRPFHLW